MKPYGKDEYEKQLFSILTTEKEQDGRIVYANTNIVPEHIKKELNVGGDVGEKSFTPRLGDSR